MDETNLNRIAAALERLSPVPQRADLDAAPAYHWSAEGLMAIDRIDAQPLAAFAAIDAQKAAFFENSRRLAAGIPAHDVLLWGARGMGKSALVRAVAADLSLALVQVDAERIADLPQLFRLLSAADRPFLVFIDDLGIDEEASLRALRSVLDGVVAARPDSCRLAVTSNRRHLIKRHTADNEAAASVNPRDTLDDKLALAERFGLSLGFHACSQDDYLAICRSLAQEEGVEIDPTAAIQFATQRGARSGRIARHYVTELRGKTASV